MSDTNEQWKAEGNCEKCRRAAHCQKACTARKKRAQRESVAATERLFGAMLNRMFGGR